LLDDDPLEMITLPEQSEICAVSPRTFLFSSPESSTDAEEAPSHRAIEFSISGTEIQFNVGIPNVPRMQLIMDTVRAVLYYTTKDGKTHQLVTYRDGPESDDK
jgi:hypothetical protein